MKRTSSRMSGIAARKAPHIVCGTDFSDHAQQAGRVAAAIAKRLDEPMLLVHALDFPGNAGKGKAASVFREVKARGYESLKQEAETLCNDGVIVDIELPVGRPDEALVNCAKRGPARLVVVSSLGKRRSERWFLGSASERTAERASAPTLVVRDASPFEAWTRGERPLKVFVAFNFTVTSEVALRWVNELQAIGPCDVVVGYLDWPPEQRTRLGGAALLPLVGNLPQVQVMLERDLKARVAELLGDAPVRLRVEANWGRPDARLAEMAKEESADLLVVGSHQYRGFERLWHTSVSRGLLHSATMNVAVVPLTTRQKRETIIGPPVQRVLVTTDFSDLANTAIPHAYSLLRGGGTVHLVHVMHPRQLPHGEYEQGYLDQKFETRHSKLVRGCIESLRSLIPEEAPSLNILSEVEVCEHEDAGKGICQAAERFSADVICICTHGYSGLSKALYGSVAQKVMAQSKKPLLVIRPRVE